MTSITTDKSLVTLINVFTVSPENQQHLVDLLVEATQHTMRNQSGYISANIHKSLDGTRVINYAQWRSPEDFEAIGKNPVMCVVIICYLEPNWFLVGSAQQNHDSVR